MTGDPRYDGWIAVAVSGLGFLTALLTLLKNRQQDGKLGTIELQSNGRLTHALDRVAALERLISLLGYPVPASQPLSADVVANVLNSTDPNVTTAIPIIPPARPYVPLPRKDS